MKPILENLRHAVKEYEKEYRKPGLPELNWGALYVLFPDEVTIENASPRWPDDEWPHSDRNGLYFILARDGDSFTSARLR